MVISGEPWLIVVNLVVNLVVITVMVERMVMSNRDA